MNDKKPCKFLDGGKCVSSGIDCSGTVAGGLCPLKAKNLLDREIARLGPSGQRRLDAFQKHGGE